MKNIKKVILIIVAVCALFCVVGCSVQDYFDIVNSTLDGYVNSNLNSEETQTSSSNTENPSEGTQDSSSSDVEDDETETLITPDDVLNYVAFGLEMNKTAVPRFEGCTEDSGCLRFYCSVSADLKATVEEDENKRFATLICPLSYFDEVNLENYTYMNWVTAFDSAGVSYLLLENTGLSKQIDGSYAMSSYLSDISYSFVNREVVAMGVLITTDNDGNETYKYSMYASGNYRTNARSLAYVAAESLNMYALGQESYTAEQIELCKTYVNWSVDKANGLIEPTDDNSTYTVSVSPTAITLNVGETATVNVSVTEISRFPVFYKSLNEDVATVSENGKIKGVATGTTIVAAYVAGVPYTVRITVV